jgi:hypothetical protein
MQFAGLAEEVTHNDTEAFKRFIRRMDPGAAEQLKEARKRVRDGYQLRLLYVTLGSCSATVEQDARRHAQRVGSATLEVLASRRVELLLRDYLDGAAPPIPSLDLALESSGPVKVNGVLQRYDTVNKLESWVITMRGDAVANLVESAGARVFARNIRGFLGEGTPINRGMAKTLREEPDHFFYYNNGITIVCGSPSFRMAKV